MLIDIHAHVTTDVDAQLARMDTAGVDRSVLLMTRVHPEAAADLPGLEAEFARLAGAIGGAASPAEEYRTALKEAEAAREAHPDRFAGFVNVPLDLAGEETASWLADHLGRPGIVGAFGGLHCLQLIEAATEIPNLHLDLSSALQVPAVRAAVATVPEQCLFGSNTPYGDVAAARATVEAAVTDPHRLTQVLGGNALRLLQR